MQQALQASDCDHPIGAHLIWAHLTTCMVTIAITLLRHNDYLAWLLHTSSYFDCMTLYN